MSPFAGFEAYGQAVATDAGASCAGCSLWDRVNRYLMQPFTSAADNTEWVLFVGFVLIVAYLWSRIIRSIADMV